LFSQRCAGCHVDRATFRGVYGRDRDSVYKTIRTGGANTMSMPAWDGILRDEEIEMLTDYVRRVAGWN
jgi:mono/diheme cytochrome c family protein